jgi:hypothetical protein
LAKFYEYNRDYPSYIFVYRDGVSDTQFDRVIESEVPQIEAAFAEISTDYR